MTKPNRPVVITRPLAQAHSLARRVEALGREAVIFPLLEIHPLSDRSTLDAVLQDLRRYAMVAFVSPNAIDAVFDTLKDWPPQVKIAVVGEGSKAALAAHGVTDANASIVSPADSFRTDSQTLLQSLDFDALHGKRVLIVRGESGRELLTDALRANGVQVEQVAAYRRTAPRLDQAGHARLLALLDVDADWIITSSEALRVLLNLVQDIAGPSAVVKMQQKNLVVPHVRIAETAESIGFVHVALTGSGDERLLAALQSGA